MRRHHSVPEWLLYVFGAFLLFTGVKMALAKEDESGIGEKPMVRWLRGHLRMTDDRERALFIAKRGLLYAAAAAGADYG